ncbi:RibD family protein [Cyanobium sp. ATX 6F1]|uniref:RibD family protein n=1 Tax=unclassified Cyanobium TaxID=2627006 RepID=UPI0020CDCEFC|nr:dihydrofolate reductase family protein [Cyanobium sp. ATX 6F1]MCP9917820.1 dihydrofolate reductase family protein [Cyanobium sp. ATX 6F1]
MSELRLVLAVSLDGRLAPAEGGPAQLGGAGDRIALEQALAWADGALIGAQTLRLHGSTCLIRRPELLEERRGAGQGEQPIALVVSRSGAIDPSLPFFHQPLERWLLAPLDAQVTGFERRLALGPWPALLGQLGALGLNRLVVLGGARLAGSLLQEALVDELQLTLCPQLLGGAHSWLPPGTVLPLGNWELLEHRSLGEGELLLRYGRRREPGSAAPSSAAEAAPTKTATTKGPAGRSGAADP